MAPKRAGSKPPTPSKDDKRTRFESVGAGRAGAAIDLSDGEGTPPPKAAVSESQFVSPAPSKAAAKGRAKPSPPAASTPQVEAKPGLPLHGTTMAFTGEMDSMTRVDAEEKAKMAGAKVMGNLSGNTTYLVMGSHLDDGRQVEETSKYRAYEKLKEKGKKCPGLLREEDFLKLLPQSATPVAPVSTPVVPSSSSTAKAGNSASEHANWVNTHAPKDFGALIGNASVVKKLTEWLRDWDDVVLKGRKKMAGFKPGGGMPDNVNARAALVSGPPGIGKTTACRLVAELHGSYEVLEYNASDSRSQKIIQAMAEGIADNRTLSFSGGGLSQKKAAVHTRRAVIIMDEVDGMGGGDRGGNAALIKMIKKTRNPIICICNDAHSQKVRSLAFSCYDLKFSRPTKSTVAQRCAQIAEQEGLSVEPNALEELAESCGSDMRMVLNQLQMLSMSKKYQDQGVKYMDMKEKIYQITKDQGIMLSTFDACKKLLNTSEGARMSFRDRMEMFFVDHSIMGLLVQENYLHSVAKKPVTVDLLERCAKSADLMSLGDVLNSKIRDEQEWSLLPDVGVAAATYPAHVTNGFIAFPAFPQWLGKYSTQSKMHRLCRELHAHLRLSTTVSVGSLPTSGYPALLYKKTVQPLINGGTDALEDTVKVLDAYGLRKEHLMEHLTEMRMHLGEEDLFKVIDPKVKAAMTREFNNGSHAMRVVLPSKGKRKAGAMDVNPDEIDEDELADAGTKKTEAEGDEVEKEEEDSGAGSLIKMKGKAKAKAKGKANATSSSEPAAKKKAKAKAR